MGLQESDMTEQLSTHMYWGWGCCWSPECGHQGAPECPPHAQDGPHRRMTWPEALAEPPWRNSALHLVQEVGDLLAGLEDMLDPSQALLSAGVRLRLGLGF